MQVPGRCSIEFNPLRVSVVRKWLCDSNIDRTSGLILNEGTNANAAVHDDDDVCRPIFDEKTNRCVSCAHLGANRENSHMSLRLQHTRARQMSAYIAAALRAGYAGNRDLLDPELMCRLSGEDGLGAGTCGIWHGETISTLPAQVHLPQCSRQGQQPHQMCLNLLGQSTAAAVGCRGAQG